LEMPKIGGGLRSLILGNLGILAHFRHSFVAIFSIIKEAKNDQR